MSAPKLLFYLAIVTIATLSIQVDSSPQAINSGQNNTNKSHNLIVGRRMPGDRIVQRRRVVNPSPGMTVIVLQQSFTTPKYDRISLLKALDQTANGNGAEASILKGGPGYHNVTMRSKSQRGQEINFIVELYAQKSI